MMHKRLGRVWSSMWGGVFGRTACSWVLRKGRTAVRWKDVTCKKCLAKKGKT